MYAAFFPPRSSTPFISSLRDGRGDVGVSVCLSDRTGGGAEGALPAPPPAARSVAAGQVDRLSGEGAAGALGHSPSGRLLAGEGHQGLPAPLPAQVVQDEDGVRRELPTEHNRDLTTVAAATA